MRDHPRAVERDLLVLRRVMSDLTLSELASVVLAAPPLSSVHDAVAEGWTKTDHLIANLTEQLAGVIQLTGRYDRPGLPKQDLPEAEPEVGQATAAEVQYGVMNGGSFDRFASPSDFQKRLAMARAKNKVSPANEGVGS